MPKPTFSWDEVDKIIGVQTAPPNAFTVAQYCEHYGVGETAARRELNRRVKAGQLGTASLIRDGQRKQLFWVVES